MPILLQCQAIFSKVLLKYSILFSTNMFQNVFQKGESLLPKEASLFQLFYSLLGSPVKRLSLFL